MQEIGITTIMMRKLWAIEISAGLLQNGSIFFIKIKIKKEKVQVAPLISFSHTGRTQTCAVGQNY